MTILGALIPVSLLLGGIGLAAFIWSIRSHQYDDLEGDQQRTLFGGHDDEPME
ncbi:MAG: cbb3-type cytochrome oxidase assembly protein CcoS [Alphaproteobacteria bacterium]|nr:MAG: cbb3-type cytochrome oxidase assembly protein CcoS [Alphaproteobacteria bacterium]